MHRAQSLWQKHLDFLTTQFVTVETEQDFCLPVHIRDHAVLVGDDQSIRTRVEQLTDVVGDEFHDVIHAGQ